MSASAVKQNFKALILAGGKGTRLRPLTYAMAKQLVPVANKPILFYALDTLYNGGVRDYGIIISPETGDDIQAHVHRWKQDDVEITFITQNEPLGLAHAVKVAQPYLGDSKFIMYLGDNLINADIGALIDAFVQDPSCDASIMLKPVENPSAFGVAELDSNGNVTQLVEKPEHPKSDLAMIGVYLFTPKIFEAIAKIKPSWRGELEITDAIQKLIDDQGHVKASIYQSWWLDTGKKDDLLAANRTVLGEFLKSENKGTVDEKTTLSGIVSVGKNAELTNCVVTGPVQIGAYCRIANTTIGPYTSIGDACEITNSQLENSVLLENCVLEDISGKVENSLLGKGCRLVKAPATESHQFLLADHSEVQVR